jgi:hypothetical protein
MLEISKSTNNIGATFSSVNPNIYNQFKKDQDGEVFEKVVFDLMLNKYSDDPELSDYILSLPNDKQRMALLSLIDGDTALWSKMNSYVNECSDKFEHIKDVIKIMSKFVKDGEIERKKFGEVMTPISLVREMLNTLPKEVWYNPNLKWLDPANGAGTFPYVVIYMLMNGLSEWEPDVEKRYKHIVENMIYTCELQSRNVFLWLCGVDPKDEYTTNSYWGSFLDEGFDYHMKNVWGVDKFDIVIGNPPYQDSSDKVKGTTGKKNLYQKFILKSNSILIESGLLSFVNPPGMFKTTVFDKPTEIFNLIKSKNLIHLNLTNINEKFFKVGTPICYFILKNDNEYKSTKIITEDIAIDLNIKSLNFIPRLMFLETLSIIDKVSKKGIKFNIKRDVKNKPTNNFITLKRLNHINKNGKFNAVVGSDVFYDLILECSYPNEMVNILDMKLYRFLNYTLRHDGVIYHYFMNGFCYPDGYEKMSEDDVYKYFSLSTDEIKIINKIIE